MADVTVKEKVEDLRVLLKVLQEGVKDLHKDGVTLNFNVASDQKTVDVKTTSFFEIQVKATINQEL